MSGTEAEPLFALLELMLRTFTANTGPKIKPGGHPEDIFVNLNAEEKEEIECAICYQILKDVRECQNKHAFCYSCIFVWSTSGNPINHSRCPVCRVEGLYVRNNALDERINAKIVKCSMNKCKWKGPLEGLASHQHTLYSEDTRVSSTINTTDEKKTELPVVANSPAPTPVSTSRSRSRAGSSQISSTPSSQTSVNSRPNTQRQPLGTQSLNNSNNTQTNSRTSQRANGQTTTRSRTRSRHRSSQNTSSPQRRSNISATGLTNRLTSRARIQNNGTIDKRTVTGQSTTRNIVSTADENQNPVVEQATTETVHVPHPPTTPRSSTITPRPSQTPRRLPTLPNLLPLNSSSSSSSSSSSNNSNNNNSNSNSATNSQTTNTDNNNNVRPTVPSTLYDTADTPRRFTLEASIRRPSQPRSFGIIRERLNESRQRLDMLMNVFSVELDRGRQDLTSFQEERERRRQEQLAEVRDLGRRLTQVATELRGLLSQRRQIRTQMDNLLESASDDQDE